MKMNANFSFLTYLMVPIALSLPLAPRRVIITYQKPAKMLFIRRRRETIKCR